MDTLKAFMMGEAARLSGAKQMVFDWLLAVHLIKKHRPQVASAGLAGDWEYTGGTIYKASQGIVSDEYLYLSSNWATPSLDLDGVRYDCYISEDNNPNNWNAHTVWPEEARAALALPTPVKPVGLLTR